MKVEKSLVVIIIVVVLGALCYKWMAGTKVWQNSTSDESLVTITGTLVEKTYPGMVQIMVVALEVDSSSIPENFSIYFQDKGYVYLKINGNIVGQVGLLGEDFQIGDRVTVSGHFSTDDTGNLFLDIVSIQHALPFP